MRIIFVRNVSGSVLTQAVLFSHLLAPQWEGRSLFCVSRNFFGKSGHNYFTLVVFDSLGIFIPSDEMTNTGIFPGGL